MVYAIKVKLPPSAIVILNEHFFKAIASRQTVIDSCLFAQEVELRTMLRSGANQDS